MASSDEEFSRPSRSRFRIKSPDSRLVSNPDKLPIERFNHSDTEEDEYENIKHPLRSQKGD